MVWSLRISSLSPTATLLWSSEVKKGKDSSLAVAWGTFSWPTELVELVPTAG